ncbi:HEAT repeat domain-containing protein [Candidatus Borrarchaeum sp.]|uniref:HEAT repeat domain-containing protein n=1 Tax=Candidatus Borrarchaeum sp. TaxID=2846742 RepID=UPI00257FDD7B|nr:HEAT repeat domain-containing protein [Candidatus Borrarchaeum sp.]
MSNDEMKSEKKQSSPKALSFNDIEQKLLEEDISTIERLIDELKNKDEKIVTRIKKLLIRRGQFAVDTYIQVLNTSHDQIYVNVVDILLEIGKPSVIPLIHALDDPSEEIRNSSKSILIQLGKTSVPSLIRALEDPNVEIRNISKEILTQIGKPGVTSLIQALDDPSVEIRNTSKEILTLIGKPAVDPLLELLLIAKQKTKQDVREILINIGEPVVRPLMNVLKEPSLSNVTAEEIEKIILEIGETGVKTLIKGLKEPDPIIRRNVEKLLLHIGEASTPLLLNVVKDKDKDVSTLAKNIIRQMGQIGIKPLVESLQKSEKTSMKSDKLIESINLLGEISSSKDTQVFLNDLEAPSEIKTDAKVNAQIVCQSINTLLPFLHYSDDIDVQRCAIKALGEIGEPIVLDPLIGLLDSPSWQIRADARDVVSRLRIDKFRSVEEKKEIILKIFPEFKQFPSIEDILKQYKTGSISSEGLLKEIGTVLNLPEEDVIYHFDGMFLDKDVIIEKLIKILQDPPKPRITLTDSKKQLIMERYPEFELFDTLEESCQQYEMGKLTYEQLIYKLMDIFNIQEEEEFFLFLNDVFPELNYLRENLILLLGKFEDAKITQYLLNMAEDINPRIRWITAWSLRNHINEKVLNFFADRIKNPSYEKHVRWMSVIGLGKKCDQDTIDALLEGVKDSDENIALWSSYALDKIGNPTIIPLIETLKEVEDTDSAKNVKMTLVKLGKDTIKPLIEQLEESDETLFEHIKDILSQIGTPAIRPLIKSLDHPDKKFIENVMKILTSFDSNASGPLIKALGNKNETIKLNAMRILYNIGDDAIQPLISSLEQEKSKEIKENMMKILYKMGEDSIPSLINAFEGDSTNLKRILITLLSEMTPKSIIPLLHALNEPKEIAENAKIALLKIGEKEIAKVLLSISRGKEFSTMHKILEGEKEFRDFAFRIKRLRERAKRKKVDNNKEEID